jgi:hypothetical protein
MRLLVVAAVLLLCMGHVGQAQTPQPGWIADAKSGCRVWTPYTAAKMTITWTGACGGGMAQGKGTLRWFLDGKLLVTHDGEFRDGKANGRGVFTWADGERYEGEFRDGKANGRGVFTWADGERYEGEWRDGKPNGFGQFVNNNGAFNGVWVAGCFRDGNRRAWVGVAASDCP